MTIPDGRNEIRHGGNEPRNGINQQNGKDRAARK